METLRKFIAMVLFIYLIGVTGLCLWLGLSTSSSSTKLKETQLTLEQERERYKIMEKKLLDDNARIAEKITGSQQDRDTAKTEYQNAISRTERLIAENDAVKKDLDSTKAKLSKVETEKSILEIKLQANVEPLLDQARAEARVAFEKEKLKLTRELADVRDLFQKVQSERDNMTTEYQKNKSENNSLRDEKASLEKKVSIYDKQLRTETQEKNKLSGEIKELREANTTYSKDNATFSATNTKLQQQLKENNKELSLLKTLLADSKEQVAKLSKERDGLDIQFIAEKSEKSKYYDESKKYRELSDKLTRDLSTEKDTTRKLSEELNAEKTEKTSRINELAKLSDDLKSKNKILAEDLRKATTEKEDVLIKWKSADDKIVLLEKDIKRLEEGKKSLEAKYETRDKEFQKTESEYQKTQRNLAKLEQEHTAISETLRTSKESEARTKEQLTGAQKISRDIESRLRAEIGKNEDQITTLANQNTVLQDSLTKSKSDLQSLTNNLKSEQAEKYKYYEECKLQTAKNTELQRQVENANLKIQSSDEEKKLSAERLKDAQAQADTLRKENTGLKTQSISLDTQISQLKTQLDIASKQLTEKDATLSAKIVELNKSLAQTTDEKEKIREEKGRIEEARVKSDKEYRAISETVRAYDAELSKIRQVNADLQNKLVKSEETRSKTEKELAVLSDAFKTAQEAERKSQEQLAGIQKTSRETEMRMKEQMAKSEEQITALSNTAKKLGAERESQDKQLKDLNEQLGFLAKENKNQKEQLAKLEKDVKSKAGELASLQNVLNEEKTKSQDDKAKYEESQAKNEEQINTLKSDVSNLTATNKKLSKQSEAQDKQLRDRDEQIMTLSKDNKDYKERGNSLEKQLSKVESEARTKITELNDKLRSATSERDDTLSRLRFTMDKVSSLEKDIKRYEDTNKSLEVKYESRDKDYRTAEIERQKVSVDLKNANDKITLLQKDKEDVTISLKNAESQIAKTKESFAKSEEELRLVQKALKDAEVQNTTTVTNLQSQIATLKEQVGDLSKSLKVAVDEREKVKEEKSKNELSLTITTKDNNSLKDKNDQLLKDLSALQSKIKVQEYELNEALKKERESYQLALSDLNTTRETLRGAQWQVSELQTKNATLDKSVASLQNQLKNQESDMGATIKQERDMKNNYQSRLEDAEGKINNYMKVEIDLRQKNSTLEKEMAGLKVTMDDKIAEAMKQKETDYINRLREANERVKVMEETLTRERSSFYAKLAEYATTSRLFDDAIEYYEKALVLAPKNATYYYNMGILYDENIDNPSKAIFCYSKYLELTPDAADHEKVKKWIENLQKRQKGSKDGFQK